MVCSTEGCGNEKVLAKGLCQPCYYRMRRRGTLLRTNVVNTGLCSVDGCDRASFAKNFCKAHYDAQEHPLKHVWKILRSRAQGAYPPGWDRFDAFLMAVGERPTPKHQLRRNDPVRPWSTDNMRWVEPVRVNADHMSKDERAAYGREWHLNRRYGITTAIYNEMLEAQGGVCPGCRKLDIRQHHGSGEDVSMHVDHNHETGRLRGILCLRCNTALGLLREDPDTFDRLKLYVEATKEI